MDCYARKKNFNVMTEKHSSVHPLLITQDLEIGFHEGSREHLLLHDLNLALMPGEIVCFMGVNGVGKSTLIRTLSGLQKPLRGGIRYSQDGELSTKVAVVLTDRVAATHLTVYELITFGRYPYLDWRTKLNREDLIMIDAAIDKVNIRHLINKRLYQLSDGQLQMAMIARALTQEADIILLDEPTAHLDLNNRVEIMNILRRLSHEMNKAVLVATHELDLALQMADSIWLAGNDQKIQQGIPEDLVLKGCFDDVFKFKGFDLKTGKVLQLAYRNVTVNLIGEGHAFRWTKNALERNGFNVSENAQITVSINHDSPELEWQLIMGERNEAYDSIFSLLKALS
jgi:iron complex transport system ATP-binding protein